MQVELKGPVLPAARAAGPYIIPTDEGAVAPPSFARWVAIHKAKFPTQTS